MNHGLRDSYRTRYGIFYRPSLSAQFIRLTLGNAKIQDRTGLATVAVRSLKGRLEYNPTDNLEMEQGDAIIVIADNERLQKLHELTEDT